ncbi:hypothetical protein KC316_g238 [Hortaea werneckii]|nr:hypothetical protein KC324_g283 [Hortaea werneckii]KAI7595867.1 hypothetical protein KC316_g238 [Hortaea werneckii]
MQMVSPGSELSNEPNDPTPSKCPGEYEGVENTKHAVGPISQDQLAAEVKGIYAELVKVEARCITNDAHLASQITNAKLAREEWQALVAIHRTLLYEYYDFFVGTQHPSATDQLKALPARHCMFARMWEHAIHSFLEVLLHRREDSQEYLLAFVYLAYQMMALLLETVPSFEDTWIECLGDLARYRMAIEKDIDLYGHWAGVASWWYIKATDKHPEAGRLYHHLGILERPSLQKFACYGKSQTCIIPFPNTKDAMTSLCTPLSEDRNAARTATRSAEASLCRMFARIYLQQPKEAVDAAQKMALNYLRDLVVFAGKTTVSLLQLALPPLSLSMTPSRTQYERHTIQLSNSISAVQGLRTPQVPLHQADQMTCRFPERPQSSQFNLF